jgi:hypothetical protein
MDAARNQMRGPWGRAAGPRPSRAAGVRFLSLAPLLLILAACSPPMLGAGLGRPTLPDLPARLTADRCVIPRVAAGDDARVVAAKAVAAARCEGARAGAAIATYQNLQKGYAAGK